MWSKISNALKPRHAQEELDHTNSQSSQGEVMSKVFEQHPNLSVFHSSSDHPIPNPSPPSSPSKRRGMFKRLSKVPPRDDAESLRAPSPMRLPIGLPKKVKSSLHLNGNSTWDVESPLNLLMLPQALRSLFLEPLQTPPVLLGILDDAPLTTCFVHLTTQLVAPVTPQGRGKLFAGHPWICYV